MTRAWTRSCAACCVRKSLIFLMLCNANLQHRAVIVMWSLKVSWSSKITPRFLTELLNLLERLITAMNAVNAVLLFILVWTFTAVCRADKDFSPSCENVTGFVGKEVNLTCKVSRLINNCCIKTYKIKCPDIKNDTATCKKEDSCEQSNSFTCSYTPTTAMTENCSFFVQTTCGRETIYFTVNKSGPTTTESVTGSPGKTEFHDKDAAKSAVVGCFIIIIVVITIAIFSKPNQTSPELVDSRRGCFCASDMTRTPVIVQKM